MKQPTGYHTYGESESCPYNLYRIVEDVLIKVFLLCLAFMHTSTEYGKTVQPSKGLTASIMPVSHGQHPHGTPYESSAYFIQNDRTKKEFLIFGDVEPDSVSGLSLNRQVWRVASHKIANGTLSTIFIECSYCVSRPGLALTQIYG